MDKLIKQLAQKHEACVRLQQPSGVGPVISTALIATVGDARQYPKGRQMAAAIGITPKQHSSGDRDRLPGIGKRGDIYLRTLTIHGAKWRSLLQYTKMTTGPQRGRECAVNCVNASS